MQLEDTETYDIIVIGGGPAGMMAAGRAAERGKSVLLLEKNGTLGKKLSITGGGRCNITNAEYDVRTLLKVYEEAEQFLYSPFSQFGVEETFSFFEKRGLPLVVEARKRAFPETQKATDVTRVMKNYVKNAGVKVRTGIAVRKLLVKGGKITSVHTDEGDFFGKTFIMATGGVSQKSTGSTGEGFKWLKDLGHRVVKSTPNIVPLYVKENWVKNLSGTSLSFMKISFFSEGKRAFSKTGKILFTHFGVSGPLILNSANEVGKILQTEGAVEATIDMYPDTDHGALEKNIVKTFDQNKNKDFKNILPDLVPKGMAEAVLSLLGEEVALKKAHSITKDERKLFVQLLKAMPLTITDLMGYEWAVISDGGVPLKEVDMKTMQSKLHDNLYVTGDALHISRPTGGYSLQLCWTTGWVAGSSV